MSKRFTLVTVALSTVVAFLVGLIIAGEFTPSTIVAVAPGTPTRIGAGLRTTGVPGIPSVVNFADVAERINAAVVNIDSMSKGDAREPQRYFRRGDGPIEGPSSRDLDRK